jgi:hypothetical protein
MPVVRLAGLLKNAALTFDGGEKFRLLLQHSSSD